MRHDLEIECISRGVCVADGRLLLCRRRNASRSYLPGGHIEPGEGARTALRRELLEELGQPAKVGRFIGAVEHLFCDDNGKSVHEINLIFEVRVPRLRPDRPPVSAEEKIGFEWIRLSALPRSDLEPWPLRRRLRAWLGAASSGWDSTIGRRGLGR